MTDLTSGDFNVLIQLGREIAEKGLTWGTSGNLSLSAGPGRMLVTAKGSRMGALSESDLVEYEFDRPENAKKQPSKEAPLHAAAYRARPEIKAIIHASPFYTTMAACTGIKLLNRLFVENMYYLERVAYVDYYHPGSQPLTAAIGEASRTANIIIMKNHGIFVLDETAAEAFSALEAVENTCRMQIAALASGLSFEEIQEDIRRDFIENGNYKKRRVWVKDGN